MIHQESEEIAAFCVVAPTISGDEKLTEILLQRCIPFAQQQRVAVARALVNRPEVLLADEPTGNLDPETSLEIMGLLERINLSGTTVIMATHDRSIVDRMSKRVVEISAGQIIRDEKGARYREFDTQPTETVNFDAQSETQGGE